MFKTDESIKRDLVEEMYWDYRVDASDIQVEIDHGKIKLTGFVPSYSARHAATTLAWGIKGVKDVTNLLTVRFPETISLPTDDEIKDTAERTLAWNPDVYSIDIDVSVSGGRVRLEGTVDSYWKRWKAESLVSDLRGVTEVDNHLAVAPADDYLDQDIARDIEAALERSLYVDAEKITVKVEAGEAILVGTAPTYFARNRANNAAAFTPGVLNVENKIMVV